MLEKPRRNDPCPCGSGKKYKSCCLSSEQQKRSEQSPLVGTGSSSPLAKRKFTAKVLTKEEKEPQKESSPGGITPPSYDSLMERAFGKGIYSEQVPSLPLSDSSEWS